MITAAIIACAVGANGQDCKDLTVKATGVSTIKECLSRLNDVVIPQLAAIGVEIRGAACKVTE